MLKQIKKLGITLIVGLSLIVTGCSNKNELTATLTELETEYYAITDVMNMDDESDMFDTVAFEQAKEKYEELQESIKLEQEKYEKDDIEYKMLEELDNHIDYKIEAVDIILDATENIFATAILEDEFKSRMENCKEGLDKTWEAYENYKEELEIETNPIKSTAAEEKENKLEESVDEEVKEETKSKEEEKLIVCAHCEKSFKESEIQRVGENNICNKCYEASLNGKTTTEQELAQCYDCGDYKPVDQMTFNGRSYHCGCLVGYCEACGTSVFKGQDKYSNGHLLCSPCYQQEQDEMKQYEEENNQILYGTDEETYTCPDCGYTGSFGTLCDCE